MSDDRIFGPISQIALLCAFALVMMTSSLAALNAASMAAGMSAGPSCGVYGCSEVASR
ncbi:MAG: hypothetical protein NW217_12750 [Hyphomicrobiaceae bacterium]|nr:hypothetical protein [Hyphomicrobiaceae bacterium]